MLDLPAHAATRMNAFGGQISTQRTAPPHKSHLAAVSVTGIDDDGLVRAGVHARGARHALFVVDQPGAYGFIEGDGLFRADLGTRCDAVGSTHCRQYCAVTSLSVSRSTLMRMRARVGALIPVWRSAQTITQDMQLLHFALSQSIWTGFTMTGFVTVSSGFGRVTAGGSRPGLQLFSRRGSDARKRNAALREPPRTGMRPAFSSTAGWQCREGSRFSVGWTIAGPSTARRR